MKRTIDKDREQQRRLLIDADRCWWSASAAWSRSCRCSSRSRPPSRSQGSSPTPRCSSPGRDIYIREGCYICHSQMIRPFRAETERYGHYSVAGESVYDHPFQWGCKRTGPDLARVGGRTATTGIAST